MTLVEGNVAASGGFAFVSQQAWILNDSLKENILFGNQYDKDRSALNYCVTMQDKKKTVINLFDIISSDIMQFWRPAVFCQILLSCPTVTWRRYIRTFSIIGF